MASNKFRLVSAATTNLTPIRRNVSNFKGAVIVNTNAAARYVKLYDSTSSPTVGADAPALTITIPASGEKDLSFPDGVNFGNSLWLATTTGVADSDATAVVAGDLLLQIFYA